MFGMGGLFNDPFFREPFAQMDRMMSSMMGGAFGPMMGQYQQQGFGPQQQGYHDVNNRHGLGAPVIEEVHDDDYPNPQHDSALQRARSSRDQPIVEEPDDDPHTQHRSQRQRRSSPARPQAASRANAPQPQSNAPAAAAAAGGAGFSFPGAILLGGALGGAPAGAQVFSYSSSSMYSSSAPGGVAYQASTTTRVGPSGVRETQSTVRDGRTGTESITIARGVGDRERVVTRTRDASGREKTEEQLRGVQGDEAERFDEEWRRQAEQNLLLGAGGGSGLGRLGRRSASQSNGAGAGGSGQPRYALPSSGGGGGGRGLGNGLAAARAAGQHAAAAAPPVASARSQPGMSRDYSYAPQFQQQQQSSYQQQPGQYHYQAQQQQGPPLQQHSSSYANGGNGYQSHGNGYQVHGPGYQAQYQGPRYV